MRSLGFPRQRQLVHLLHIGKTGGTALKAALDQHLVCRNHVVVPHGHSTRLRDVPETDLFMFCLRDPITRFVSGFYSRQRQGRPRYFSPWREEERVAFERFDTPNALASGLRAEDGTVREAAATAMRSIRHVRSPYTDWFESPAYLRSRSKNLFFVGRVESLEHDFARLRTKLGLPGTIELPVDPVAAHRSPSPLDRRLEPEAIAALEDWYARDYEFIELCRALASPGEEPRTRSRRSHATPALQTQPAAGQL